MAGSRVGCGLSLFSRFLPVCPEQTLRWGVAHTTWYWKPSESSPHPDMLPYRRGANPRFLTATNTATVTARLDLNQGVQTWDYRWMCDTLWLQVSRVLSNPRNQDNTIG